MAEPAAQRISFGDSKRLQRRPLAKVQSTVTPTAHAVVGSMVRSVAISLGVGDGTMIAGESVSNVVDGEGCVVSPCRPGGCGGDGCGSSVATVGDLIGARGTRVIVGNGAAAGGVSWGDGIGGGVS
jgi:hypothetical protein